MHASCRVKAQQASTFVKQPGLHANTLIAQVTQTEEAAHPKHGLPE